MDASTGKTTVEKFTAVADVGKINNKLVVDGQMYGGIAQGIGLALSEDCEDLQKHHTLASVWSALRRGHPGRHRAHLRGDAAGERPLRRRRASASCPLTSPHVAVINAIKNATGVRITHLPALPEKVLAGLQALG